MYCYHCGTKLDATDSFCSCCGTEQKNMIISDNKRTGKSIDISGLKMKASGCLAKAKKFSISTFSTVRSWCKTCIAKTYVGTKTVFQNLCQKTKNSNISFLQSAIGKAILIAIPVLLISVVLIIILSSNNISISNEVSDSYLHLKAPTSDIVITDELSACNAVKGMSDPLQCENAFDDLENTVTTTIGTHTYYRMQQNYNGIPVYGKSVVVVADNNGEIVTLTGNAVDINENISLSPEITDKQAQKSIKKYIHQSISENAQIVKIGNLSEDNLYIFADDEDRLVYAVEVWYSINDTTESCTLLVDAKNAQVLHKNQKFYTVMQTGYSENDPFVTANVEYIESTGTELDGKYFAVDSERNIFACDLNGYDHELPDFESRLKITSSYTPDFDHNAIQIISTFGKIYDYYYSNFEEKAYGSLMAIYNDGYDSGNNAGGAYGVFDPVFDEITEILKSSDCNIDYTMPFGLVLTGTNTGCSDIDVLAHEYTHVVSRYHCNWTGSGESAAINEAFSDIMGVLIEGQLKYYNTGYDWYIETDNTSKANRNIAEPSNTGHPTYFSEYDSTRDGHYNSTIISHMAYLMHKGFNGSGYSDDYALSDDELAELWYRTICMTPSTCTFAECATLVEMAAESMGLTEKKLECVHRSIESTGITGNIAVDYILDNDIDVYVYDTTSSLYGNYTLRISGNAAGARTGYHLYDFSAFKETYSAPNQGELTISLPQGMYTFEFSDNNDSSKVYAISVLVIDGSSDKSIELYTGFGDNTNDVVYGLSPASAKAYAEQIQNLIDSYGTGYINYPWDMPTLAGLAYVELVDFDKDGRYELLCGYSDNSSDKSMRYINKCTIYRYNDGLEEIYKGDISNPGTDFGPAIVLFETNESIYYVSNTFGGYNVTYYSLSSDGMNAFMTVEYGGESDFADEGCRLNGNKVSMDELFAAESAFLSNGTLQEYLLLTYEDESELSELLTKTNNTISLIFDTADTNLPSHEQNIPESTTGNLIDNANLLIESEASELRIKLDEISERQQFAVVVVTVNSLNGKSIRDYADDFYDYNGYGYGTSKDGVLLLISMDSREWHITTTGFGIKAINDEVLSKISADIVPLFSNGEYNKGFVRFAEMCDYYVTAAKGGTTTNGSDTEDQTVEQLRKNIVGHWGGALDYTFEANGDCYFYGNKNNSGTYKITENKTLIIDFPWSHNKYTWSELSFDEFHKSHDYGEYFWYLTSDGVLHLNGKDYYRDGGLPVFLDEH